MPKYIVDTDAGTVTPYVNTTSGTGDRMVEILQAHRGKWNIRAFVKPYRNGFTAPW